VFSCFPEIKNPIIIKLLMKTEIRIDSSSDAMRHRMSKYTVINKTFLAAAMVILIVIFCGSATGIQFQKKNLQSPVIAFISDTQEPMSIEKLWLKSDNNELATNAIFYALRKERNISAVFHLGDITAIGFCPGEWDNISGKFSMLKKSGIPVYPTMGNHEYLLWPSGGKEQFLKHFPQVKSWWYVKQVGAVAVILLNSNFPDLSSQEISAQQKWYLSQLKNFEQNASIKYVIVGTHYSPYTNSKIVGPSYDVQKYFVPAFLKNRKCKLFISGHAHTFEHFKKGGKDFIVTGGGGGLLHPLLTGREARYKDLYSKRTRTFNYVTCEENGNSLLVKVKMLNKDYRSFSEVYNIGIER
jgi:predicted phosphodiesterase